jgi:hypothetical protein
MNTRNRIGPLIGCAAMVASVVGLTAGIAPAAAAPAQSGATLAVVEDAAIPGSYKVTITGAFPMQQADAVGFITHISDGNYPDGPGPGGIIYHLVGDDDRGWPNDSDITGSLFYSGAQVDSGGYLRAGPSGLEYHREITVNKKKFNEDDGVFDDQDEIYAVASFRDGDGGERHQFSQAIVRYFEASEACKTVCA